MEYKVIRVVEIVWVKCIERGESLWEIFGGRLELSSEWRKRSMKYICGIFIKFDFEYE